MPSDVAVDEPCTGVVKLEGDGKVAVAGEGSNVTARRVDHVQGGGVAVPHASILAEDEEVVAVQVDGVPDTEAGVVLNDKDDELGSGDIGSAVDNDDVVVGREVGLAVLNAGEGRVLPVNLQTAAVEGPLEPGAAGGKVQALGGDLVDGADIQRQVRNQISHGLVSTGLSLGDAAGGGGVGSAGAIVANNTGDTIGVGVVAAGGVPLCAQPVVSSLSVGLDNDIITLAHANLDGIGGVGDESNKIVANNSEAVAVNGELEVSVGSGVDNSDAVLLASLENSLPLGSVTQAVGVSGGRAVEGVGAVDEAVLHSRRATVLDRVPQFESLRVAPVVEEHHAEILIVVSGGRTVQDQASESTLCVLQSEVTVVPGRAILGDGEVVGLGGTRGDGALSNTRHTIGVAAVELPQTMPVDGSTVGHEVVGHVDLEVVTPVGLSRGTISYPDGRDVHVIYMLTVSSGPGTVPLKAMQVL